LHYSYWNYHDYFRRMERYSTYQALKWHEQGRPVSMLKLFFNLPLRFLQLYILRLGILDGLVGLQVCVMTAVYSFCKQACLWQLQQGRSPADANRDATDVLIVSAASAWHYRIPRKGTLPAVMTAAEPTESQPVAAMGVGAFLWGDQPLEPRSSPPAPRLRLARGGDLQDQS